MSEYNKQNNIETFAGRVFAELEDGQPRLDVATRHVRKTARSAERTVEFKTPVLKVASLAFAIALAEAKAIVPTEHRVKSVGPDGKETETVVNSTLLDDEVKAYLADVAEDATEAYLKKGQLLDYMGSFVYGVAPDRETEKSVNAKLQSLRAELGQLYMALDGEWTDDVAKQLGVPDREAAIAKRQNIALAVVSLHAKSQELAAAKAKREAKAATKPAPAK
ncbi:MAG: hypothetical protein EBR82_38350 [Caulobacteraceae bacterium]|nr:hypothetical protein [Caulobacteraceae bacterium]